MRGPPESPDDATLSPEAECLADAAAVAEYDSSNSQAVAGVSHTFYTQTPGTQSTDKDGTTETKSQEEKSCEDYSSTPQERVLSKGL